MSHFISLFILLMITSLPIFIWRLLWACTKQYKWVHGLESFILWQWWNWLGPDPGVPPCDILYVHRTRVHTEKNQNSIAFWFFKPTPNFRISKPIRFNNFRIVSIGCGFGIGRQNKSPSEIFLLTKLWKGCHFCSF